MGPKFGVKYPYKRHTEKKKGDHRRRDENDSATSQCLEPPEAGRDKEQNLP